MFVNYISSQIKQLSALITEMEQFFMFDYSQENIVFAQFEAYL